VAKSNGGSREKSRTTNRQKTLGKMNEKNLKLLQIYFSESQRKVIQSHKVIQDNIDGFIEAYSALSLSGALDNSVYQIIYPIRRSLDYIHGLRLKSKDQALEKLMNHLRN
jgi:hypothetical protein